MLLEFGNNLERTLYPTHGLPQFPLPAPTSPYGDDINVGASFTKSAEAD